jgi:Bacterial toxin 24
MLLLRQELLIQAKLRQRTGKTTKYSTYDENGKLVKQVEADKGEPRHGTSVATKKVPTENTLPDGTVKPGKPEIKPATPDETPPGTNH